MPRQISWGEGYIILPPLPPKFRMKKYVVYKGRITTKRPIVPTHATISTMFQIIIANMCCDTLKDSYKGYLLC